MGSISPTLRLDFGKPSFVKKAISDESALKMDERTKKFEAWSLDSGPRFVKTIRDLRKEDDAEESKIHDYVQNLEDEKKKIEPFKLELPTIHSLLEDTINDLKKALKSQRGNVLVDSKPVLKDLMPLNKYSDDEKDNVKKKKKKKIDCVDKKNWIQLWNDYPERNTALKNPIYDHEENIKVETKRNGGNCSSGAGLFQMFESKISSTVDTRDTLYEFERNTALKETKRNGDNCSSSAGVFHMLKDRNRRRTFLPLKAHSEHSKIVTRKAEEKYPLHELALFSLGVKRPREESGSSASRISSDQAATSSAPTAQPNNPTGSQQFQQQPAKKRRRCWSADLHRRFVTALEQLGGAQAATPKQIKERMQVDGLTNDEVKSHLQKYRLNARKAPAATAEASNKSFVLSSLLLPDRNVDFSKLSSYQSLSPESPLQLAENNRGTIGDGIEDDEDEKPDC